MTKWTRPEKKKLTRPQIPPHPLDWWLLRRIYYFNATHLAQRWRWFILSLLSRTPPSITLQSSRVLVLSLLSPFWLVSSRSLIEWMNQSYLHSNHSFSLYSLAPLFSTTMASNLLESVRHYSSAKQFLKTRSAASSTRNDGSTRESINKHWKSIINQHHHHQKTIETNIMKTIIL